MVNYTRAKLSSVEKSYRLDIFPPSERFKLVGRYRKFSRICEPPPARGVV